MGGVLVKRTEIVGRDCGSAVRRKDDTLSGTERWIAGYWGLKLNLGCVSLNVRSMKY